MNARLLNAKQKQKLDAILFIFSTCVLIFFLEELSGVCLWRSKNVKCARNCERGKNMQMNQSDYQLINGHGLCYNVYTHTFASATGCVCLRICEHEYIEMIKFVEY